MDDNSTFPNDTNQKPQPVQPQQPIAPLFSGTGVPQAQPVASAPANEPSPLEQASMQQLTPDMSQAGETYGQSAAPRLTLEDMYGASQPQTSPNLQGSVKAPEQEAAIQPEQPSPPVPVDKVVEERVMSPVVENQEDQTEQVVQPVEPVSPEKPVATMQITKEEVSSPPPSEPGSHFGFPPFLKLIIGGGILFLFILLIVGIGSFFFKKSDTTGHVKLTYWGLWEDANVMQPILADFQKQHPNITVEYSKQDPKEYVPRLLTRTQDGSGPDIFRFNNSWAYPLQSMLLPLASSVVDVKTLQAQYPPVVSQDLVRNGAVYGLPMQMDTLALFVNNDIFTHAGASVPTTWDNFITVAKALTVKDPTGHIKTAGAALGTYENIEHAPDIFSLLLLQNGANEQKLDNSKNANDALTFYTSFARPEGNVWDSSLDNSLLAFERGSLAMYFGYSYDIFAIKATAAQLNFAVYPVPHLPGRDMTIASYWVDGVSTRSKHPKEAMELMQYLAQKDTQARIYTEEAKTRIFGELYANTDLAEGLKGNKLLSPFITQYKGAQSTIFAGNTDYNEYNEALNGYLKNAINSTYQDTSIETAMTTLSQGVAQITAQYGAKSQ